MLTKKTKFKETVIGTIPEEWNIDSVENISNLITDYVSNGSFASLKDNVEYSNNKDYAILVRLLDFNRNFSQDFVYVNKDGYNFLKKTKLYGGEIVISNVGEYAGTVFRVPFIEYPMTLGPNSIMIKTKFNDAFYYYWLISIYGKDSLKNIRSGSAVPKFNKTDFKKIIVPVPSIEEQQKISEILSSLDDKIELNRKINDNLEKIASSLFKRWFVDFEFPNKDGKPYKSNGGKMINSEMGEIPDGLGIGFLGDDVLSSFIKSGIDKFDSEKIYLDTASVNGSLITDFSTTITIKERPSRANMQPQISSVWFAKMKDSRKLLFFDDYSVEALDNYILSTGFAGFKVKQDALYYIWTLILSSEFDAEKNSLCQGTTMQAINNENISKIKYLIPSDEILLSFNNFVKSFYQEVEVLKAKNIRLSEIRDSLLSKLMSGKIRTNYEK